MIENFKFFTIGVYGSTEDEFFNKLITNNIDTFIDVRRRRGVRGSKYSFVNSKRLQKKLDDLNIYYEHIIELSPTKEIRELQKNDDFRKGILKRERNFLSETFKNEFKKQILDNYDFEKFLKHLEKIGSNNIIFFCVEKNHLACHRSLIAKILEEKYNYKIRHL